MGSYTDKSIFTIVYNRPMNIAVYIFILINIISLSTIYLKMHRLNLSKKIINFNIRKYYYIGMLLADWYAKCVKLKIKC